MLNPNAPIGFHPYKQLSLSFMPASDLKQQYPTHDAFNYYIYVAIYTYMLSCNATQTIAMHIISIHT